MQDLTSPEAYIVSLFAVSILYGVFFALFVPSCATLFCSSEVCSLRSNLYLRRILLLALFSIFILETISVIINLVRCIHIFFLSTNSSDNALEIVSSFTYFVIPISDGILLYRCFILWGRRWSIIIVPMALETLVVTGCTLGVIGQCKIPGWSVANSMTSAVIGGTGIATFALNLTLTILIAYRIQSARRHTIPGGITARVQTLVVECGLLWTGTVTILLVTSLTRSTAELVTTGIAKHMSGIAFCCMILSAKARSYERTTDLELQALDRLPEYPITPRGQEPRC